MGIFVPKGQQSLPWLGGRQRGGSSVLFRSQGLQVVSSRIRAGKLVL